MRRCHLVDRPRASSAFDPVRVAAGGHRGTRDVAVHGRLFIRARALILAESTAQPSGNGHDRARVRREFDSPQPQRRCPFFHFYSR